jgi:hypothetical protein
VRRVAGLLLAGALAITAAGCSVARVEQQTPDSAAAWVAQPLPPDPALAVQAVADGSTCRLLDNAEPIRVLVQDRRTERTAAFLVGGATQFGSCLISKGDFASGGAGPALEPMTAALTIDANGNGGPDTFPAQLLGGRVDARASTVEVRLADGQTMNASLANSYWLAWWPGSALAVRVVARDAAGVVLADVAVGS